MGGGLSSNTTSGGFGSRSGFGGGGGLGGFGGFGGFGGLSSGSQQTAASLAGQVSVIADPDTNSLLIRTSPKNYDSVKTILNELDRPVPQVLIKVLVAEVTHDNSNDVGVELSALNLRASGNGQSGIIDFGLSAAQATNGGFIGTLKETNFTAVLYALEQIGKLDVLSRPYILASDNQLASIIVGQTVPIPTESRVTDTGQTISSVSYTDIGIILNVTPHINPDGLVILDVNPEISSLSGQSVPTGPGQSAPIFNKRSADSRVGIIDGRTIVIGGLMEDRKTQTLKKVPILGDIPGLGWFFRHNTTQKTKTELLIFLTPHVASRPDLLTPMSEDEMKGTKLTPNAVEPGAFDEHMRGMQRGGAPTTLPADPRYHPSDDMRGVPLNSSRESGPTTPSGSEGTGPSNEPGSPPPSGPPPSAQPGPPSQ
jgi:general secretion pathway protein D